MVRWLNIPDSTKKNAYEQIAENTGMSAFAVEKDWWVVQTLRIIFEMGVGSHLVFKGGTSLSKSWGLIQRFSEDVDLAIDRSFLGFEGELSKSRITALRKEAGTYTSGKFKLELEQKFKDKGFENLFFKLVDAKDSDQDPRIIEIYYPHIIQEPEYLAARVQIEIGCRSLKEPFTVCSIASLIDLHYPTQYFVLPSFEVPSVNPERTFLEKIFLLHEEFQRPFEKIRVDDRLSRHLYDVVSLSKTEFAEIALTNPELYETIVIHRHKFTRLGGVNYNLHQPKTINPIPIPEVIEDWRKDYNKMLEQMIYEENPYSFDELIEKLKHLTLRINSLDWKFNTSFPLPNQ